MYCLEDFYENIYLSISNDYSKFNGTNKIKVHDVGSDNTQGHVLPIDLCN